MYNTIKDYLQALKTELQGSDPALIQDALADASEHLTAALAAAREANPDLKEEAALTPIVDEYGSPQETAAAYREVERRTPVIAKQNPRPQSLLGRFFGVYVDPRTWGALLFMFISIITGIVYFTWAVTGISLSLALSILIIGLPIAILFLLSVQGITLLEGRLVEALLGVRMPRRPAFAQPGLKWKERLKALVTDRHTWVSLVYMVLQLVLGVIYFSLTTTFIALSLGLIAAPFIPGTISIPDGSIPNYPGYNGLMQMVPLWVRGLIEAIGLFCLTITLHFVRTCGWLHGRYAKWMLVS